MLPTTLTLDTLRTTIDRLRATETLLPPPTQPDNLPTFLPDDIPTFPPHGPNILIVIPTANKQKTNLLTSFFNSHKPPHVQDSEIHYICVPAESGVGEQPYDDAGVEGARNRILNALRDLTRRELVLEEKGIGTVMAASIENCIWTPQRLMREGKENPKPVDYGVVMVVNARTGGKVVGFSEGVTVPGGYYQFARQLEIEGEEERRYGKVTVGEVLAANVPGLDKADWHAVVAGVSRYELLRRAMEGLEIPW